PDQFDAGLAYALSHRPEIQGLHEKVRQSRMAVDKAQAGYIPSIDAFGKLYYNDEDMSYDLDRENWTAGILFNWELFQGFYTRADENEAQAIFEEMLLRDRKTTLAVELEVKTAYLGLTDARARLEVAHQRVANAEESLKLVGQQYEGGSATVTRYLEAEQACNQARLSQAAALYDCEKALADIARAIGYLAVAYPVSTE
ncbi:MAG: TolC family protein, partial [Desulfobacteraceae bacterium]|nr:TolC family protein [Desulfobacteraceae bacterium]